MAKIKKSLNFIKTVFKTIYYLLVLLLLGVIGFIIYCLHPLYMELKPTVPDELSSSDKITWTFYRYAKNPAVFQRITVFNDGGNIIEITRENGDFDNEMLGPITPWQPKLNKDTGIITFKKKNVIAKEKAKDIFKTAINNGVMDIKMIKSVKGAICKIDFDIGGTVKSISGPDDFTAGPIYPPEKWINNIYWEKLISLIDKDPQIQKYMLKTDFKKGTSKRQ